MGKRADGLGTLLLNLRRKRGLTLSDVSAKSRAVSADSSLGYVSHPYLSQIESGRVQGLSFHKLLTLASIYETPVESLIAAAPPERRDELTADCLAHRRRQRRAAIDPEIADLLETYTKLRGVKEAHVVSVGSLFYLLATAEVQSVLDIMYQRWTRGELPHGVGADVQPVDEPLYDSAEKGLVYCAILDGLAIVVARMRDYARKGLKRTADFEARRDAAPVMSKGDADAVRAQVDELRRRGYDVTHAPDPDSPAELARRAKARAAKPRRRGPRPGGSKPAPPPE